MKSITIVSPIYFPETNAGAKRSTAIAEYLAAKGWKVTVATVLPNHPQNQIYEGFDVKTPLVERVNGVEIYRVRPWLVPKDNFILRLISEMFFSWHGFVYLLRHRSDIVLATCPYIFTGPLSLLASKIKGSMFVWDVRDLIWQYVKAANKKSLGLDNVIDRLMHFTARSSNGLVGATEGILKHFKEKPALSMLLPNGVTHDLLNRFQIIADKPIFRNTRVHVIYAGLLGFPQGLSVVIDTARLLPNFDFTFLGDGPERSLLELRSKEYNLKNVNFTGYLSQQELLEYYQKADILIAHLRKNSAFELAQPSKIWEYMSTGRPVIHAAEDEAAEIIKQNSIGLAVPPENPQALAEAITYLFQHPQEAQSMGQRGRAFVEHYRNREKLLEDLEKLLEGLLKPNAS
jgi:glycosyltransferase involved in cell wall biosynthesis